MTDTVDDDREFNDAFDEFANGTEQQTHEDEDLNEEREEENSDLQDEKEEIDEVAELRKQLDQIKKERDDFEHSFKSQVGRVSALQKKIDSEKKEEVADTTDDEIKAVLADYPEIAGPIIKAIEKKYGAIKQEVDSRFEPIVQSEQQRYINDQAALLDKHLPEWRETINKPEYDAWLKQQPQAVQSMDNSIHAQDLAYLVNAFKATQPKQEDLQLQANELAEKRRQKLAANEAVQSKGQSKKSVAPDDFDKAWDYYAARKG